MSAPLRIEVRVDPGTNPELFRDLVALPAKRRAERLRTLGTLGMVSLTAGFAAAAVATGTVAISPATVAPSSPSLSPDSPIDLGNLSGLGFS